MGQFRRIAGVRLHAIVLNRQRARLHLNRLFVCLAANCRRDACVPSDDFL
ncbi:MAG: hypothetical protein LBP59_09390 [Planctomycetaceae bacterium]|nr:hypothetical protein [Planctomycetaceae bacterium]